MGTHSEMLFPKPSIFILCIQLMQLRSHAQILGPGDRLDKIRALANKDKVGKYDEAHECLKKNPRVFSFVQLPSYIFTYPTSLTLSLQPLSNSKPLSTPLRCPTLPPLTT